MSRNALAEVRRLSPLRHVPRQSRSEATVEFVLEAAQRVVDEVGVANATMTRIAEVAGVSVGSLYQYFRDKQAMLQALTEQELLRAESEIALSAGPHADLRSELRAMIAATTRYYAHSTRLRELVLEARRPLLTSMAVARRRDRLGALIQRYREWAPGLDAKALVAATFIEDLALAMLADDHEGDAHALAAEVALLLDRYLREPRRAAKRAAAPGWRGRRNRTQR